MLNCISVPSCKDSALYASHILWTSYASLKRPIFRRRTASFGRFGNDLHNVSIFTHSQIWWRECALGRHSQKSGKGIHGGHESICLWALGRAEDETAEGDVDQDLPVVLGGNEGVDVLGLGDVVDDLRVFLAEDVDCVIQAGEEFVDSCLVSV
ncbi:MAG: hypothetical protein LQ349_003710 [Xanthoria aureola]|nr:MAG: hypothetical protein LQ349_003710 [Xanthoria aureola]